MAGTRPLEPVRIAVQCESWDPIERTVWVCIHVGSDRLDRTAARRLHAQVARDGPLAVIFRGEQPVASLGPLVLVRRAAARIAVRGRTEPCCVSQGKGSSWR